MALVWGHGAGVAGGASSRAGTARQSAEVRHSSQTAGVFLNEPGDCNAVRDPSARHLSIIVLFPQENKGSPPRTNDITNAVLRVLCWFFFSSPGFV